MTALRRIILFLLPALLCLAGQAYARDQGRPPNVILITVDTLRADRLGSYGNSEIETPAVDALAREGILFERAIAQVPLTWPSHAAIFTGTYPFHNGVQDFTGQPLSEDFRTLAQSFKANGHATGAVVSSFVLDRSWGLGRGFDFYQDAFAGLAFAEKNIALVDRRASESVGEALNWLKEVRSRPFFLWVHLFDPHSAYDPPEPFRSRYRHKLYDGEIAYTDSQLARLFDWLKKNRLYDQSIIVFTSDHGESLGEHGEDEHGFFVYNSTLHVPLIIKPHKGSPLKPRRIQPPVETISIGPTLLQLAAIQDPIQSQFQARSLVALMTHGTAPEDRAAYAETFYPFSSFGWSPLRSLQTARYHYIEAPNRELYDLASDPKEQDDLITRRREEATMLKAQLKALAAQFPPPEDIEPGNNLSPEEVEKLRSLGYVAFRAPTGGSFDPEKLADPKDKLWEFNAILRATDAFQVGDFATGEALLRRVLATEPELYLIHFLLGEAASKQGRWEAAVEEFTQTLELNPNFDEAMTGLGRALAQTGQPLDAQKWLRRAITLNPRNFRAWFQLALVQAPRDIDAAFRSLQSTLEIQPRFAPALRLRGILEIERKDYGAALQSLEPAVQLGMTDPVTHNYLGIAYSRVGRLEDAADSYRRALAARPNYAEAHLNLGFVYQRQNKLAAAQEEYEAACRLRKEFCQYTSQQE
jgi:arylsulfatase A-like enzyme/Tfp pilus assembly protein PilF